MKKCHKLVNKIKVAVLQKKNDKKGRSSEKKEMIKSHKLVKKNHRLVKKSN